MQKITIVGNDSAAKILLRSSLDLGFDILDLLPEELNISNIGSADWVIYVTESVDKQTFERLRIGHKSLILVSAKDRSNTDLFIPITNFQNSATEEILEGIRSINEFFVRSSIANLSEDHKKVLDLLIAGGSEGENLEHLDFGRSKYFAIQKELRIVLGTHKNWQLVLRAS
jgi:hypothetical protein